MSEFTLERFKRDTADHKLTVKMDNGVYRHLVVSSPKLGGVMAYQIVTSPFMLFYYGDMGTYVFSRLEDMFQFFRREDGGINEGYWYEKMEAEDRHSPCKCVSEKKLKEALKQYAEDHDFPEEITKELMEWSNSVEMSGSVDTICSAVETMASDFCNHTIEGFWEYDIQDYSFHYLWCLHAIVKAINMYDELGSPVRPL